MQPKLRRPAATRACSCHRLRSSTAYAERSGDHRPLSQPAPEPWVPSQHRARPACAPAPRPSPDPRSPTPDTLPGRLGRSRGRTHRSAPLRPPHPATACFRTRAQAGQAHGAHAGRPPRSLRQAPPPAPPYDAEGPTFPRPRPPSQAPPAPPRPGLALAPPAPPQSRPQTGPPALVSGTRCARAECGAGRGWRPRWAWAAGRRSRGPLVPWSPGPVVAGGAQAFWPGEALQRRGARFAWTGGAPARVSGLAAGRGSQPAEGARPGLFSWPCFSLRIRVNVAFTQRHAHVRFDHKILVMTYLPAKYPLFFF